MHRCCRRVRASAFLAEATGDDEDAGSATAASSSSNCQAVRKEEKAQIVEEAIRQICAGVEHVDLRHVWLRDETASRISTVLQDNCTLKTLVLSNNCIGMAGAEQLGKALVLNTVLEVLDLQCNRLGDSGVPQLADSLCKNGTLRQLRLGSCSIGDVGATHLADMLKLNTTLEGLHLETNNISDAGTRTLGEALRGNCTLQVLWLLNNPIGTYGAARFAQCMEDNKTLKRFGFTIDRQLLTSLREVVRPLKRDNVVRMAILSIMGKKKKDPLEPVEERESSKESAASKNVILFTDFERFDQPQQASGSRDVYIKDRGYLEDGGGEYDDTCEIGEGVVSVNSRVAPCLNDTLADNLMTELDLEGVHKTAQIQPLASWVTFGSAAAGSASFDDSIQPCSMTISV